MKTIDWKAEYGLVRQLMFEEAS